MSVMQTIVVFVLVPLVVFGVVAAMTVWPARSGAPRYRSGQEWNHEPVWWSAHPTGHEGGPEDLAAVSAEPAQAVTARGGARGRW